MKPASSFIAITSEGGLLPADFLSELLAPKTAIEGLTPVSYNLAEGERINEQVNRSWNRLKGRWADFKKAIAEKQSGDSTTTETRDRWLQPLFQELGYGQRLPLAKPIEVDGRSYPVSHGWGHVPIHLVGSHIDLDRRTPGAVGAAKASPHSLVQQVLNASDGHLWGMVSNGLTLRLLRDSIALTRLSYVEWDLAAIFDGDLYSEFFVLWLVAHQSRFDAERPEQCRLEKWKKIAEDKGLRALEKLRPGVARAIEALGAGLVSHPANTALRIKLSRGELSTQEFYRQVLRIIYRMLFLFVAEDRDLLHQPMPDAGALKEEIEQALRARGRYRHFYAITRLRALTLHRAGTPHSDLWHILQLLTQKLGSDDGCAELALPPLGSFLWDATRSTPDLISALVSNRHFLTAIHALAFVQDGSIRRSIDYKNLGSEELGSVYEGLLELHPILNADSGAFELNTAAGNERKTSGSYYTPDSLVQCLLDSALEPVMAEAVRGKQGQAAVDALLKLKICDPAVGSGHFLIAAAHRLAKGVAAFRSGEDEPSPATTRSALRDVIGRCLYGVDINPMSAELCRVNLWLEALEPGKPLSFLDHHIRVGNSLLGATPALISAGLPDDAFKSIEGDEKAACSSLRKLNRAEREGLRHLFIAEDNAIRERMYQAAATIEEMNDSRPQGIRRKEAAFRATQSDYDFGKAWDLADLWCAAFVIKKHFPTGANVSASPEHWAVASRASTAQDGLFGVTEESPTVKAKKTKAPSHASSETPVGITTQHLRGFVEGGVLPDGLLAEAKRLAYDYRFFHFHLAFPEVFSQGGFDVFLGNPPWERPKPEPANYFSATHPEIANAQTSAIRERLIGKLRHNEPEAFARWIEHERYVLGSAAFQTNSGYFKLSAVGKFNLGNTFVELSRSLLSPSGRAGLLNVSGLATDDSGSAFISDLMRSHSLVSFYDFENRKGLFPAVDRRYKFSAITIAGSASAGREAADFVFFAQSVDDLHDPAHHIEYSAADIQLLNPLSGNCPVFRERRQAELVKSIYHNADLRRPPAEVFWDWDAEPTFLFVMSDHSDLFSTREELRLAQFDDRHIAPEVNGVRWWPLYESKMFHQFEHRWSSLTTDGEQTDLAEIDKAQANHVAVPRYWMRAADAAIKLNELPHNWLIAIREVTNATNERTAISSIVPKYPVGHNAQVFRFKPTAIDAASLLANINALCFDFAVRTKVGGSHLSSFILRQLPLISNRRFLLGVPWSGEAQTVREWLFPRVLELTYTAWDLEPFALDSGWSGPPFRWDGERRFLLRCELDAAFFHLYLGPESEWIEQPVALTQAFPKPRAAVSYILDTFPIVRRKEEAKYNGDYRTKRVILEIYDEMAQAMALGRSYETRLSPAPAHPSVAHPPRVQPKPFVLPPTVRYPQPDEGVYAMRVMLSMIQESSGSIDAQRLMNACGLLAMPDILEKHAAAIVGDIAHEWHKRFSDTFKPNLFLPKLDDLVRRGEIRIMRQRDAFVVTRIGTSDLVSDLDIEFDTHLALRVADSLAQIERDAIPSMATKQEFEALSGAA